MLSIIYYTNNLLQPAMLKKTLEAAVKHAKDNDCHLFVVSHFPVFTDSIAEDIGGEGDLRKELDKDTGTQKTSSLYDYIIEGLCLDGSDERIHNYVVGRLPYSETSIFKQIILGCEKAKEVAGSNSVVLMEHDCLYPDKYIPIAKEMLCNRDYKFTYCSYATCFLDSRGYFKVENPRFFLSSCGARIDTLIPNLKNKISLIQNDKKYRFEPMLSSESEIKKKAYPDEIILSDHVCIDTFLDGQLLDMKHQFNSTKTVDEGVEGGERKSTHEYWGDASNYSDCVEPLENEGNELWQKGYGILPLDY